MCRVALKKCLVENSHRDALSLLGGQVRKYDLNTLNAIGIACGSKLSFNYVIRSHRSSELLEKQFVNNKLMSIQ